MWCRQRSIAIWNRNMIVVAVAISTWCTNVALLIHGKVNSVPTPFLQKIGKLKESGFFV